MEHSDKKIEEILKDKTGEAWEYTYDTKVVSHGSVIGAIKEYAEHIREQTIQEVWIILCDMVGDDNNGIGEIDLDKVHEKFKLLKQKQTINNINNLSK